MPYFLNILRDASRKTLSVAETDCVYNMMNLKEIMDIGCNVSTPCHLLANLLFYNKVLHITGCLESICNTLSGVAYANWCQATSTPHFDFHPAAMLDDRAPRGRAAIFGAIGSPFSGRGRIIQQFYS